MSDSRMAIIETQAGNKRETFVDRRRFGWRTVLYGFVRSRRRHFRRSPDASSVFIDWHHPWLFFLAVGTMLLSTADAFFTLELINRGMVEVNPIMASIMQRGTLAFVATKLGLTATGILMLVFMAKARFFDRIRTGLFLTAFFAAYACLVCYEIVNLLQTM